MKKEEFFEILRKRLSIIENNELEDILAEYYQHIELKIQAGTAEEEAISDFGDVNCLADEILEAYHVKTDYTAENQKSKHEVREKARLAEEKVKSGFSSFSVWIKSTCSQISQGCKKLFEKLRISCTSRGRTSRAAQSPISKTKNKTAGTIISRLKTFCKVVLRTICHILSAAIHFCIRFISALLGVSFGILAVSSLLCLSFLIVILFSGYPVLGLAIATLGFIMVTGAAACWIFLSLCKNSDIRTVPLQSDEH